MKILEQRYLRGPNIHSSETCLLAVVTLEAGDPPWSNQAAGFAERLLALLPELHERCPSGSYPAGFAPHLRLGVALPSVLEQVALALQRAAAPPGANPPAFGSVRAASQPDCWEVVFAYRAERVAALALAIALELVNDLLAGRDVDLLEPLGELKDLSARCAIGTSTGAVLRAAGRRGIPSVRLLDEANLFLLGWGKRQRRLQATITGNTSHVAVGIASDKQLTKSLLQQAGLPVPEGETVSTLAQAQAAARRLAVPVTIKPLDANHGKGVTTTCVSPEDIAVAFEHARHYSRRVIVERFLRGRDYRVLVAGDRVAAAAWRRPPQVSGDGVSTVRQLVERENQNPARGAGHTNILTQIALDAHACELIERQGWHVDSVLPQGAVLALRDNANLSTGGTAEDVTDLLPQETVRICVRAARAIGLDIAGIDIVCDDIGRPLRAQGGGIIEVNAAPGIRMHEYPSAGQPRDAGDAIVEALFGQSDGRIPLIAVSGSRGAADTVRLIEQAARVAGLKAGQATADGVRIGDTQTRQVEPGLDDFSGFDGFGGARAVLSDTEVELAVLETSGAGVLATGLGYDRADVAVVLQMDSAKDSESRADIGADLARAYEVVARSATRAVVLNADDERCVGLGATLPLGVEKLYFARQAEHPVLLRHLGAGGRALYLQGGTLVLAVGQCHQAVIDLGARPGTVTGLAASNIVEVLAAAAALVGAGFAHQAVAAGLQSVVLSATYALPREPGAGNETMQAMRAVLAA